MKRTLAPYLAIAGVTLAVGMAPMLLNAVVDPFNKNGIVELGLQKEKLATKRHGQLYKTIAYPRRESAYVVFGDSRSRALREKLFRESRWGQDVFNFSFGGGTFPEMVDSFWYAARYGHLKGVVLGVPLRMFTSAYKGGKNQMPEAVRIAGSAREYYTSLDVSSLALDVLEQQYRDEASAIREVGSVLGQLFGAGIRPAHSAERPRQILPATIIPPARTVETEEATRTDRGELETTDNAVTPMPAFDRESIPAPFVAADPSPQTPPLPQSAKRARKWHQQVTKAAKSDWEKFQSSEAYYEALEEIIAFSRKAGIKVLLFIPPTPIDMQRTLITYDRMDLAFAHRKRLAAMAPVLDFDFPNPLTAKPENFNDAFHFHASVAREIAHELVRQFGVSERSEAWISKRRRLIQCPAPGDAAGQSVSLPGDTPVTLGRNCLVWG